MKTATWSHSVNSEDFLVSEASDVLEMRLPDPSANLASISSAKPLKVRDNVKRFDTIFSEILEESSDLTQELKRTDDHLPPASGASWAPLQSCWSAPFPQKRTTLQSTASSLRGSLAARDSLEIGSSIAKTKQTVARLIQMCTEMEVICGVLVSVGVRVHGWMVQRRVPRCSCVNAHTGCFVRNGALGRKGPN